MEISNIDFSSLFEMVDTFYKNAWIALIVMLGAVGVAWPIVLKKFSDYRAKIEVDKLEKNLREQFQNLSNENVKLIEKEIEKEMNKLSEAIDNVISKKLDDIDIKINVSRGLIWHTLGTIYEEKNELKSAFKYYFYAFECYFYGKNESNLQNIILCIRRCYEKIKDLSFLKGIENKHLNLINKLNEINENSRYSNTINEMEEEFNSLKKKLKKGKN
ncbi:unnamed protein product [marine sediment metagenome]|uniref:Uncharacterized protein n=1 Tax=marine sediment metagenome TaxID=412755 RepID=X1IY83_9ZZZZ